MTHAPVPSGERPLRDVLRLSLPLVATMATQSLMGLADVFFMRFVGTPEQAAVGLGSVMHWTIASFFTGTLATVTTFVSQSLGAGRPAEAGGYAWQAFWPTLPFALLLPFSGPLVEQLLRLTGATPDVAPLAARYVEIRLVGAVFTFAGFSLVSYYRGLGNMLLPMWVALVQNLANLGFNVVLVFGLGPIPALGLDGTAWATVLATVLGTVVLAAAFLRRGERETYGTLARVRPDRARMREFARVGVPVGVAWMLEMAVWTLFTIYVSSLGDVPLAAHNIVMGLVHLSFLPGVAISIAAGTRVGQQLGADRPDAAERYGWAGMKLCLGFMGGMGLLFVLLRGPLSQAFAAAGAVRDTAAVLLPIAAAFQLFDAVQIVSGGALRGAGDTRYPMYVAIGSAWLVFLPAIYLLGTTAGLGVEGAWAGAVAHLGIVSALLLHRFRRGAWKSLRLVPPAE